MLLTSRYRVLPIIKALQTSGNQHAIYVLGPAYHFQQSRTVRTKGGTGFYTNAIRRDERLLKRLEAQLANVQTKIKREEEEALELMKKQNHHGTQSRSPGSNSLENHNFYFWEKVLTQADRNELTSHEIHSLDELYSVYEAAEAAMSQPPYSKFERLPPRLQLAHQMYLSLPKKLSEAGHAKARSRFGGWF